jgi:hypothetical protein
LSITVEYFFNSDKKLPELAQELNLWVGSSLAPYEGDATDYFCRFLGMELSLSTHTFENEGACNFEDFKYYLSLRTSIGVADLRIMQIPVMIYIAYCIYRRLGLIGLLVFNGQIVLARYEEQFNQQIDALDLYDLQAGEFVDAPHYIDALSSRISKVFEPRGG